MIFIMTAKKFKKICQEWYFKGYMKGYMKGRADSGNSGFVISSKLKEEIEQMLKGRWN